MTSIDKAITLQSDINNSNIIKSKEKVFFIQYITGSTIKERWYLLQVDIEHILNINPLCTNNGKYYYMLLENH